MEVFDIQSTEKCFMFEKDSALTATPAFYGNKY